jgi:hypothetical protein
MPFILSEKQQAKLEEWLQCLPCPEPIADHPDFPKVSYEFNHWSGIGPEVKAIENVTGASIDLTDVTEW